jgi:hypothetical protein
MSPSRRVLVFASLSACLLTSACTDKPSEADCEAFADHFVKLLQESREKPDGRIKKLAQDQRDDVVGACVADGSKKEVACVMEQTSLADVATNCK